MLRRAWRRKLIIISFFLLLILPSYCISNFQSMVKQKNAVRPAAAEGRIISYRGSFCPEEMMLTAATLKETRVSFQFWTEELIPELSLKADITIKGCGGDGNYFEGTPICEGRFLNDTELINAAKVCVISNELKAEENIQVGKSITIHGTDIDVVGVYKSYGQRAVIVPYSLCQRFYTEAAIEQNVMVLGSGVDEAANEIIEGIKTNCTNYSTINVTDYNANQRDEMAFFVKMLASRAFVCIVTTGFSLFNIFVFMLGTVRMNSTRYAIRRAIGAKRADIYKEIVKEYTPEMTTAALMNIILFHPIMKTLHLENEVDRGWGSLLAITVVVVVYLQLICMVLSKKVMSKTVAELLRDE